MADRELASRLVLCVGDGRADEDMFNAVEQHATAPGLPAEAFCCVVGQKPSRAPHYLNDSVEVVQLLAHLAGVTLHGGESLMPLSL